MSLIKNIKEVIDRKELVSYLLKSDLKIRYKNMSLGFIWAILDPFFMMLIYVLLISVIFKRGGDQYPVLLFAGLLPYRWFSFSLINSSKIILSNANIIKSVKFPFSILVINEVNIGLVNYFMGLIVLVPMLFIFKADFSYNMLFLPLIIAVQYVFVLGLGLIFSAIGVYFRDIQNILMFVTRLILYLSPVLYDLSRIPEKYQKIYLWLNPLASLFENYKNILVKGKSIDYSFGIFVLYSLVFLLIGMWIFNRYDNKFSKDV